MNAATRIKLAGTVVECKAREMVTLLFAPARPSNPDGIRQKFKAAVQQAIRP